MCFFFFFLVGRVVCFFFFFSSRRRHTRCSRDWSSDVCSSDLDARAAAWVPVESLGLAEGGTGQRPGTTRRLAFDHARILADGLERARSKLEYTPLAASFVTEPFTISELRMVYETVWGEPLHAGNFHRKVLSVPGFVEGTGETTQTGGPRGGPRARLYRRGDARLLHPALLRPGREDAVR